MSQANHCLHSDRLWEHFPRSRREFMQHADVSSGSVTEWPPAAPSPPPLHGARFTRRTAAATRPSPAAAATPAPLLPGPHRPRRPQPPVPKPGTRAGRTTAAGPAMVTLGDHRRQHRRQHGGGAVDRRPQRGLDRPGRPGLAAHIDPPAGGRPPGPWPPPAACSPTGCPPADAPAPPGNTTGPRSHATPSPRPGSARTRAGRRPDAGSTSADRPAGSGSRSRPYPSEPTAPIHT